MVAVCGQDAADVLGLHLVQRQRLGHAGDGPLALPSCEGKSAELDQRAGGENDAALDDVAQLADVARPGVAEQGLAHRRGKAGNGLAVLPGEEPQQVLGQGQDVVAAARAAAAAVTSITLRR